MENKNKILLIEDDDFSFLELTQLLKGIGYNKKNIIRCSTLEQVMNLEEQDFQLAITDLSLPDSDYVNTFIEVHDKFSYLPIIVLTGVNEIDFAIKTIQNGAQDYLVKGDLDQKMLGKAIQYAIERKKITKETENILQSITDGFFTLNNDGRFTYVNRETERTLKQTKEQLLGKSIWEVFPEEKQSKFYSAYQRSKRKQVSAHFVEKYLPLNIWISVNAYPTKEGLTVYFVDVTEQHNHVEMIEEQNKRLKEIAWIQSHEVRGPIANIMGLLSIFNTEDMADPANKEIFDNIKEATDALDEITRRITYIAVSEVVKNRIIPQ